MRTRAGRGLPAAPEFGIRSGKIGDHMEHQPPQRIDFGIRHIARGTRVDFGGYRVNYSTTARSGSRFVEMTVIGPGGKVLR